MTQLESTVADRPAPQRVRKVVMVVDVVESVRLMQHDEDDTIDRWRRIVRDVMDGVLPPRHGRMVKSLGDGMLVTFDAVAPAVAAAMAIHELAALHSRGLPPARAMALRVGLHMADVVVDGIDIYGSGVNLTARVAGLAQAGKTVVTAEVRDELLPGLDVDIEDLGKCYLKHLDVAVRAFRLSPPSGRLAPAATARPVAAARPTLLVAPLRWEGDPGGDATLADLVTNDLILQFGRCGLWNVISRLSTDTLRARRLGAERWASLTDADYPVSGSCRPQGGGLWLTLALVSVRHGDTLWEFGCPVATADLLSGQAACLHDATRDIARTVVGVELKRAEHLSLPTLEAYAILFRSVWMLHKTSVNAVLDAQRGLDYLVERHPREPEAHAWAARSQVLQVAHGSQNDPKEHAARARDHLRRALDIQPQHALALTIEGLVRLFIERDLAGAEAAHRAAIQANPNEHLAWLFLSSVHSHRAEGEQALQCVQRAALLSPLDPMDHYFDGVTAWACLANGDPVSAEAHALKAVRTDCTHRPTFMTLAQAQALQGKVAAARASAAHLLALSPGFGVAKYLDAFPGGATPFAQTLGDALALAGVPS